MATKLKVYGINLGVPGHKFASTGAQVRAIVAAVSQVAAAKAFGIKVHHMRDWGSATGNDREQYIAKLQPGKVFVARLNDNEYELLDKVLGAAADDAAKQLKQEAEPLTTRRATIGPDKFIVRAQTMNDTLATGPWTQSLRKE